LAAPYRLKGSSTPLKSILATDKTRIGDDTVNGATNAGKSATHRYAYNGHIGRGTRYRLGEVLCGFFPAEDLAGTEEGNDVVLPLGKSLKLAAEAALLSCAYPNDSVRVRPVPASLQSGAWRYWVGIARGARAARQLLTDLDDSTASRIGWPLYWTDAGAYLFSDSTGRTGPKREAQYYNLLPPDGRDYEFLSRDAAINRVIDQVWNFDHLGERGDIPDFGAEEIVAGAAGDIGVNDLSLEKAGEFGARLFDVYCGGSQSPILSNARRFVQNALGCQVRCARAKIPAIPALRFAMYAKGFRGVPSSFGSSILAVATI
jgi:hypothetical protein